MVTRRRWVNSCVSAYKNRPSAHGIIDKSVLFLKKRLISSSKTGQTIGPPFLTSVKPRVKQNQWSSWWVHNIQCLPQVKVSSVSWALWQLVTRRAELTRILRCRSKIHENIKLTCFHRIKKDSTHTHTHNLHALYYVHTYVYHKTTVQNKYLWFYWKLLVFCAH